MPCPISIHAPREGGDNDWWDEVQPQLISIHAPREGGDDKDMMDRPAYAEFQSTPPARGATGGLHLDTRPA